MPLVFILILSELKQTPVNLPSYLIWWQNPTNFFFGKNIFNKFFPRNWWIIAEHKVQKFRFIKLICSRGFIYTQKVLLIDKIYDWIRVAKFRGSLQFVQRRLTLKSKFCREIYQEKECNLRIFIRSGYKLFVVLGVDSVVKLSSFLFQRTVTKQDCH